MTVIEKAQELANQIKNDPILVEYYAANAAYQNDQELQELLQEYATQKAIMGQEFTKEVEEQSKELLDMVRSRIDEICKKVAASESYKNITAAQVKVNDLMTKVNGEIQKIVFGYDPSEECTHDCSSCHANCSSKETK